MPSLLERVAKADIPLASKLAGPIIGCCSWKASKSKRTLARLLQSIHRRNTRRENCNFAFCRLYQSRCYGSRVYYTRHVTGNAPTDHTFLTAAPGITTHQVPDLLLPFSRSLSMLHMYNDNTHLPTCAVVRSESGFDRRAAVHAQITNACPSSSCLRSANSDNVLFRATLHVGFWLCAVAPAFSICLRCGITLSSPRLGCHGGGVSLDTRITSNRYDGWWTFIRSFPVSRSSSDIRNHV